MTNLLPDVEPLIDAMVARLLAELNPMLVQVNAAAADAIVCEDFDPLAILDYVPVPSELNRFPCVAVSNGPHILSDDVGWSATLNARLVLITYVQAADQRSLALKLRRYTQAVRSVALRGRSLPPAWGVVDAGTRPGPTLGVEDGPRAWMSWTGTQLDLRSEQDVQ